LPEEKQESIDVICLIQQAVLKEMRDTGKWNIGRREDDRMPLRQTVSHFVF
jgi:hypothetical protein